MRRSALLGEHRKTRLRGRYHHQLFFELDKMHRRRAAICLILTNADEDGNVVVNRADAERAASPKQD